PAHYARHSYALGAVAGRGRLQDTSWSGELAAKLGFLRENRTFGRARLGAACPFIACPVVRAYLGPHSSSCTESSKRVRHGEAVFCFELHRFGVNTRASARLMQDLAFFPRFFRANHAILALSEADLHCLLAQDRVRPRPDSPTLWRCSALSG